MNNLDDSAMRNNSPLDDCEDFDDSASETSTIAYEHEPFEVMKHKVACVASKRFLHNLADNQIERMEGGSNNRVIGLRLVPSQTRRSCSTWIQKCIRRLTEYTKLQTSPSEYIVRIPRGEIEGEVSSHVAILRAIVPRLRFPIPNTVAYDSEFDNDIGRPYMIQERLPGRKISEMWSTLNMAQKASFIKRFTEIVTEMVSIEAVPGEISTRNLDAKSSDPIHVDLMERQPMAPAEPAIEQTGAAFMIAQIDKWRQFQLQMVVAISRKSGMVW